MSAQKKIDVAEAKRQAIANSPLARDIIAKEHPKLIDMLDRAVSAPATGSSRHTRINTTNRHLTR